MNKHILKYFIFFLFCIYSFNATIYSQWTQQTNGLQPWNRGNAIDACDSNTAIIAVDSTLFKTEDGGNTWQKVVYPSGGNGEVADVSIKDKDHFWIATEAGGILATSDGGSSWSLQFYDWAKTKFMDYVKMFDLNNGVAIGDAVGNNPFLFLTTSNGGNNWVSANYNDFQGGYSENLWRPISFISESIGYFNITYNWQFPKQLLKTTDGGKSWLNTNYNNEAGVIKFYTENLGIGLQISSNPNYTFHRTTDGGNNWETFYLSSKDYLVGPSDIEFVPGHPSELWFVNLVNLYFSSDTGRTWTKQNFYNGNLNGSEIVFTDSNHGWLLCDSSKVFHTSNNGGIITAITPNKSNTPTQYLLMQNYPNPFNPTTIIHYALPKAGEVTLRLYDMLGREVKTLVNEYKTEGVYDVTFNASDLASGVYIYQLKAGNFVASKKLLLMK